MHFFKHLSTITKHRHKVIYHCFRCGIGFQGLFHDLSKYSPCELFTGAKYYQGNRSPNERERELFGYSAAWMHHKGRNRHHFEYWVDLNPATRQYEPVPMPARFLAEMFCDRVAASKIYRGQDYTDHDALAYFTKGNAAKKMHSETAKTLERWLRLLSNQGEAVAFAAIRQELKETKMQKVHPAVDKS